MAKNNGYTTIYSDDDIVVLNKQAGILIAADRYNQEAPRLDLLAQKEFGRLYAVHRIDKDTSGVIVYARNPEAHAALSQQFEKRTVQKTYHALVYGHPLWQELHVDLALQPDGDARHRTVVSKKYGKPSVTDFINLGSCGPYSWIVAKPKTGRTHQIRVHMDYINHPVVNDPVYGRRKTINDYGQMLHAYYLGFNHPITHKFMEFSVSPEEEFERIVEMFKNS